MFIDKRGCTAYEDCGLIELFPWRVGNPTLVLIEPWDGLSIRPDWLQSEPFSSSGLNTQLWFNFDGSPVAGGPLSLNPVALSGVDDIGTTLPNGLSDFFGTSATTPSVAAVVALVLQANPDLTFSEIEQILEETATPFGDPEVAGAGLVNAASVIATGTTSAGTTVSSGTYNVSSGQADIRDVVLSGGSMSMLSGGAAYATTVSGGFLTVDSGSTASGITIDGGTAGLLSGAIVSAPITSGSSGGLVLAFAGSYTGKVSGFGINAGGSAHKDKIEFIELSNVASSL